MKQASERRASDDGREVAAGLAAIASMRKEVRSVAVGTATDIVDRFTRKARVSQLELGEFGQVAVGSLASAIDDRPPSSRVLHFARNLFADFEGAHSNVRTDRGDELGGVVGQRPYGLGHDPCHRASPPGVHRGNVPTRRMGNENWHAVRRARRDREPGGTRDERVALCIGDRHHIVGFADLSNQTAVDLLLLEQTIKRHAEGFHETPAVLPDGIVVVA